MIGMFLGSRRVLDVPCRIDVEHTSDSLHAHVELDEGRIELGPGDRVVVHGPPVQVPYGTRTVIERRATVIRATRLERLWTRLISRLEFTELYDVSFTSRRIS